MFTVTINGGTLNELFTNLEALLKSKPTENIRQPISADVPAPAIPVAPAALPQAPTQTIPTTVIDGGIPQAPAPTYTLEQLAKAGAMLAQSGKMDQALALLNKYGVQTVNQLPSEQYGVFATELRALGAQV